MDYDNLNGPQREILRQALLAAFVNSVSLDIFLQSKVNRPPLATYAGGNNFGEVVFNVVKDAQAQGWTGDLVAALQAERPRNPLVRNLPDALRLAQQTVPPRQPSGGGMTLEKIVRGGGFANLPLWAEKMTAIGAAVCRIEYPVNGNTGCGTGLLVGDDLVMTNYHVVERHLAGTLDPAAIRCRFGYARDAKGLNEGRCVPLASGQGWIVARSPYDPADKLGMGAPAADHLDYALLRLAEPRSQDDVGGGARRGRIAVRASQAIPETNAPVFIVQHPAGQPLALSIGVVQPPPNGFRIHYDADTLGGSSGSGVFNQALELVALHHAGDPSSDIQAKYNQGIPFGLIVASLDAMKVAPFWT